jgi:hypothetical protein
VYSDQVIRLYGFYSKQSYPERLRRIRYYDAEHHRWFVFLTNNFTVPALTIAQLYKCRWQVELFFKWLKQHLPGFPRSTVCLRGNPAGGMCKASWGACCLVALGLSLPPGESSAGSILRHRVRR